MNAAYFWLGLDADKPTILSDADAANLRRAICCPSGRCIDPQNCYALDRSRAYPVNIHAAAGAVAKLLRDAWANDEAAYRRSTSEQEDREHGQPQRIWYGTQLL